MALTSLKWSIWHWNQKPLLEASKYLKRNLEMIRWTSSTASWKNNASRYIIVHNCNFNAYNRDNLDNPLHFGVPNLWTNTHFRWFRWSRNFWLPPIPCAEQHIDTEPELGRPSFPRWGWALGPATKGGMLGPVPCCDWCRTLKRTQFMERWSPSYWKDPKEPSRGVQHSLGCSLVHSSNMSLIWLLSHIWLG